jgi:DNA repair ATPase RecN
MKKLFSLLVVGLFLLAYACGGGGGDDPKSVANAAADAFENLVNDMEGANSADDLVAAINKFADKMKELKPKMKALEEKYPELKNMGKSDEVPAEFKEANERMEKLGPRLISLFGKLQKYATDPKVIEAQKKLQEAMQ